MGFKYEALRNFSLPPFSRLNKVSVELKETPGMERSDAQYIVKLNYPDALTYGDISIDKKFVEDAIRSIYGSNNDLIYLSYSRELDYFIYIVELNGKLVLSGFRPTKDKGELKIVTDLIAVSKLRSYSPKSIVIIDNTKEYKENKSKEVK